MDTYTEAFDIQTAVIGAGVVGLACAATLAEAGHEVLVIERNHSFGEEVSSRNSEVIHAGIYYPPGSIKARLCIAGKQMLYAYCARNNVTTRRIGKLIVANSEQDMRALEQLLVRGHANGVSDLVKLSASEATKLEPELRCVGALFSPSTGTVDSHGLMSSLLGKLQDNDGSVSFGSSVNRIVADGRSIQIAVKQDHQNYRISATNLINCAGLGAVDLASSITTTKAGSLPDAWTSKGNYFRLKGKSPFSHLIYPAPEAGGLGVHLTLDLAGNARFGPDAEEVELSSATLKVSAERVESFYHKIRRYWPRLPDNALLPDYAGLRPKISRPGISPMDFEILGEAEHGVANVVHCLGIESPGLTSSLAIADEVARRFT